MDVDKARTRLYALQGTLMQVTEHDSDARVSGVGLSTIKALLSAVADLVPGDPALEAVGDFLHSETDHIRGVDALIVVGQALEALPPPPPPMMARTAWR